MTFDKQASSPLMVLALAGACLTACTANDAPAREPPGAEVVLGIPGAIVVDFEDGTTPAEFNEWEKGWGVDLELNSLHASDEALTVAVGVTDVAGVLERIRSHPDVELAEPLFELRAPEQTLDEVTVAPAPLSQVHGEYRPNDPDYPKQWNFRMIDTPRAWSTSRGKGVIVAVIDTGIAYEDRDDFRQVPDLKGVTFVKGYDFVNDDAHANDDHGHGTHVAGTIAQATNNGEGVAGVAFEATLMPIKVLNHFGSGTSADIADAIRFAADNGAKVINLSLGGGGHSRVMESAVAYARAKGATVVCAAGNSGIGRVEYPAAYPGSVAVGAVGPDRLKAPYSSFGEALDLSAPGGDKRAGPEGGVLQNTIDPRAPGRSVYAAFQGTSMAAPHVAGAAALLYAAGARSPDEVEQALFQGATPLGEGWSEQYGHGLLNARGALEALGARQPGWTPLWWAMGLLAVVLLTLGRRERPGYLNALFAPGVLLPLVMSTVGLFFLRRFFGGASELLEVATLPIPDWQRIIFGRGRLANPLFYSALIPILASTAAIRWKESRNVVAGLALGFAGFLGYAAWSHAPGLAWLPFTFLAIPWLVVNALICAVIARAMLRRPE